VVIVGISHTQLATGFLAVCFCYVLSIDILWDSDHAVFFGQVPNMHDAWHAMQSNLGFLNSFTGAKTIQSSTLSCPKRTEHFIEQICSLLHCLMGCIFIISKLGHYLK
jgi:hypothetical protein